MSNSRVIAKNSILSALDTGAGVVMAFATAGIVARHLGPAKMGSYAFLLWLATTTSVFASHGVGATVGKFVGEYLGKGDIAIGKAIVRLAFRVQFFSSLLLVALSLLYVWLGIPQGERLYSALVLLSLFPGMMQVIPSLANWAAEDFRSNIIPALCATALQPVGVILALCLKWDLVGLAAGLLICRSVDFALRMWFFRKRFPPGVPRVAIPKDLMARMWRFTWQTSVLLVLDLVVWERCEVFFLNTFSRKEQVAFYSTGFSFSALLMTLPNSFAAAAGATIFAQRGRDPKAVNQVVVTSLRYTALMVFPMAAGMAALSGPIVHLIFGPKYDPAIPVLAVMAIMVIPKALLSPASNLLRALEKQGFLVRWMIVSAAVTLILDYMLIPRYGAIGAAYGNGLAQLVGSGGIWVYSIVKERLVMPWGALLRMAMAAGAMGAGAYSITLFLPPLLAALVGVPAGVALYLILLRMLGGFEPEDQPRLLGLATHVPTLLRASYAGTVQWVVGPVSSAAYGGK